MALFNRRKGGIKVDKLLKLPGLLQVCRQLRKECTSMYFLSNHFEITILNAEATLLSRWCSLCESVGMRTHNLTIRIGKFGRFANVKEWAKKIYDGSPCRKMLKAKRMGDWEKMVCDAHEMAEKYAARGKTWAELEVALNKLWQKTLDPGR